MHKNSDVYQQSHHMCTYIRTWITILVIILSSSLSLWSLRPDTNTLWFVKYGPWQGYYQKSNRSSSSNYYLSPIQSMMTTITIHAKHHIKMLCIKAVAPPQPPQPPQPQPPHHEAEAPLSDQTGSILVWPLTTDQDIISVSVSVSAIRNTRDSGLVPKRTDWVGTQEGQLVKVVFKIDSLI